MRKLIPWFNAHWMLIASCFLLAFIPLYPKIPLVDVRNTWVYVRAEDFVVLLVLLLWLITFLRQKLTLKNPLTVPVLLFWAAGAVATLHSILLIVPTVWEIFPNVALLSFIRRIEYLSLFFVAVTSVRTKKHLAVAAATLVFTVLAVSLYGLGQKYIGLPAYLTMNEEFAKGVPIRLSALSRLSSTFGGHYDLAAYFVLTIPIIASIMLSLRNWFGKAILAAVILVGMVVLTLTVSRISLFALFVALGLVLFFRNRRLVLFILPVAVLGAAMLVMVSPTLLNRFTSTVKDVDVLVDARNGKPVGHVQTVPNTYFADKTVRQLFYDSIEDIAAAASPSARFVIPAAYLPAQVALLTEPTAPTGEDLPSGTGYVNLTLSPDVRRIGEFLYEPKNQSATTSADVFVINGQYLIKRAAAYDLSLTTRTQGEWPKALLAFKRNVLVGSGYGSVSLAVDNSYLRMLGEVGLLGFAAFLSVFLMYGVYLFRVLPSVGDPLTRSFSIGVASGIAGLAINALFIDVFEASKVAFVLWLLIGLSVGALQLAGRAAWNFSKDMKRLATSSAAVVLYLLVAVLLLWSPLTRNYFVGDDFTWLRWAADCTSSGSAPHCITDFASALRVFTNSDGFFYRPGTKLYFSFMYNAFWLNQTVYHIVSLALHFLAAACVFFLGRKLFRRTSLASLAAFLFVWLSGSGESVFWISVTGHMAAAVLMLGTVFSYAAWRDTRRPGFAAVTAILFGISLMFHEMAVVTPLLWLLEEYVLRDRPETVTKLVQNKAIWLMSAPLPVYAILRVASQSHWMNGDYSFNLLKLPFNVPGNFLGYALLAAAGPFGDPAYTALRSVLKFQPVISAALVFGAAAAAIAIGRIIRKSWAPEDRRVLTYALLFSSVSLLPFLGLGNIAARYGYLASAGFVIVFTLLVKQVHGYLSRMGRDIAGASVAVMIGSFLLIHSVGLYQLNRDWNEAGEMVRRFIISMDGAYLNEWKTEPVEFHYVSRPIRAGQAWVLPVGLPDALWFVYRNPRIRVFEWPSVDDALDAVTYGNRNQTVFVFASDGRVEVVDKPAPTAP